MLIVKFLNNFGRYLILMGKTFSRPERMRMFMDATVGIRLRYPRNHVA